LAKVITAFKSVEGIGLLMGQYFQITAIVQSSCRAYFCSGPNPTGELP
jgi:hypothetical protein